MGVEIETHDAHSDPWVDTVSARPQEALFSFGRRRVPTSSRRLEMAAIYINLYLFVGFNRAHEMCSSSQIISFSRLHQFLNCQV